MASSKLNTIDEFKSLIKPNILCIVKLYMPTCPSCMAFADTWTSLVNLFSSKGVVFSEIDLTNTEISKPLQEWLVDNTDFEIEFAPTTLFIIGTPNVNMVKGITTRKVNTNNMMSFGVVTGNRNLKQMSTCVENQLSELNIIKNNKESIPKEQLSEPVDNVENANVAKPETQSDIQKAVTINDVEKKMDNDVKVVSEWLESCPVKPEDEHHDDRPILIINSKSTEQCEKELNCNVCSIIKQHMDKNKNKTKEVMCSTFYVLNAAHIPIEYITYTPTIILSNNTKLLGPEVVLFMDKFLETGKIPTS